MSKGGGIWGGGGSVVECRRIQLENFVFIKIGNVNGGSIVTFEFTLQCMCPRG